MLKKLLISEEEQSRILNLHKEAISKSKNKIRLDEGFSQTVYDVQKKLKPKYGSLLGRSGKNLDGVDGIFGGKTITALKKYQKDNNLPITGKIDTKTVMSMGIKSLQKKSEEKNKVSGTESCVAVDNTLCNKISDKNESTIGNGGGEGCSEYVRKMTGNYLGNAWQAFVNAKTKGSVLYNMFTDGSINWDNIRNSKFVNSDSCSCFELVQNRQLDKTGIYQDKTPFTFNTHVGYVGAIKNGIPIIFHSVHGERLATPGTKLLSKDGEAMITWVVSMGGKNEKKVDFLSNEGPKWWEVSK